MGQEGPVVEEAEDVGVEVAVVVAAVEVVVEVEVEVVVVVVEVSFSVLQSIKFNSDNIRNILIFELNGKINFCYLSSIYVVLLK